jgi:DNA-binding Xre family transcriptional regulator
MDELKNGSIDVLEKLEALRQFYSNLKPELANDYVGALNVAIAAVSDQVADLGPAGPPAKKRGGPVRDYNRTAFGNRVFILSQKRDLTMREIARRIGASPSCVSRYASGKQEDIMVNNAVKLARVLDVPLDYLLGLTDDAGQAGECTGPDWCPIQEEK